MTDEERARILELLAREGQEQAPGILPESDGPPLFPPEGERMVDFTEELERPCGRSMRRTRRRT